MKHSGSFIIMLIVVAAAGLAVSLTVFSFSVFYCVNGSLEILPNAEQAEKAKITAFLFAGVSFITILVLAAVLTKLIKVLRKTGRKR